MTQSSTRELVAVSDGAVDAPAAPDVVIDARHSLANVSSNQGCMPPQQGAWYDVVLIQRLVQREPFMPSLGEDGRQLMHSKAPIPTARRKPGAGLFVLNTDVHLRIACG